jgi:hypothetical protein
MDRNESQQLDSVRAQMACMQLLQQCFWGHHTLPKTSQEHNTHFPLAKEVAQGICCSHCKACASMPCHAREEKCTALTWEAVWRGTHGGPAWGRHAHHGGSHGPRWHPWGGHAPRCSRHWPRSPAHHLCLERSRHLACTTQHVTKTQKNTKNAAKNDSNVSWPLMSAWASFWPHMLVKLSFC